MALTTTATTPPPKSTTAKQQQPIYTTMTPSQVKSKSASMANQVSSFLLSKRSLPPQPPQVNQQQQQQQSSSLSVASPYTDAHAIPQHNFTHIQATLLIVYFIVLIFWLIRVILVLVKIRPNFGKVFSNTRNDSSKNSNINIIIPEETESRTGGSSGISSSGSHHRVDISRSSESNTGSEHNHKNKHERLFEKDVTNAHSFEVIPLVKNNDAINKEHGDGDFQKDTISENGSVVTIGNTGFTENLNERHHCHHSTTSTASSSSTSLSLHLSTTGRKQDGVGNKPSEPVKSAGSSSAPPEATFEKFLNSVMLFGAIMVFFYFCDYWKIFSQGTRQYNRDLFLFLIFIFFLVGSAFTVKENPDKILNRDMTEEWKGWMQVMFVWYHYFAAKEWYNWIRVYIACYVWMTGFGNFSFFWIRKDFSMWRMLKMMFRLNFLVVFVAMTTNNEYMLYYICAMHTYWFLTVYVFMRVLNSWNTDPYKMAVKFAMYAIFNAIIFDIPGVSMEVFRPFKLVLGLASTDKDVMHEWAFRAGLDHWACFVGMLCAYNYPHFEKLMAYLDSKSVSNNERAKKIGIRVAMATAALLAGLTWHETCLKREKYSYNAQHPYTSPIVILVFIVLRNIHPVIRTKHIAMFSWLGKITLETYLSQLHVYLLSNARTLLLYIPSYPLLNFALATIVYLSLSNFLFHITTDTSSFLISRDRKKLILHLGCTLAVFVASGLLAYGVVI